MAPQRGTKADGSAGRPAAAALGRAMGFIVLAGPALAIIAALVLLPAHASLVCTRHRLTIRKAQARRAETLADGNNRLIRAIPNDRSLARRLVLRTVPGAPGLLRPAPLRSPRRPSGWLLDVGYRLQKPALRRGVFAVACLTLAAAMFLFAPPPVTSRSRWSRGS